MKPSVALQAHREEVREVFERFRMRNPRIFGSTSRSEDTDNSDLDILVDAPTGASLYDLAQVEMELEAILGCKVEVLTKGFMAPDVLDRAETDLILMP
jgi:predicted nucleotidyltransferase